MSGDVIIDGNNLLHAMHAHAPRPNVGRETLVRIVDRWAARTGQAVTLVFDGASPRAALTAQMQTARVAVRFSAPVTADDVIVGLIAEAHEPALIRVVSSDSAIVHEARYRKCAHVDSGSFVSELFAESNVSDMPRSARPVAGDAGANTRTVPPLPIDKEKWLEEFGFSPDDDEPFPGHGAMVG